VTRPSDPLKVKIAEAAKAGALFRIAELFDEYNDETSEVHSVELLEDEPLYMKIGVKTWIGKAPTSVRYFTIRIQEQEG
jgi:hypothetical protein